jgi:hypothetical protein
MIFAIEVCEERGNPTLGAGIMGKAGLRGVVKVGGYIKIC